MTDKERDFTDYVAEAENKIPDIEPLERVYARSRGTIGQRPVSGSEPATSAEMLQEADYLLYQKEYREAMRCYSRVASLDPDLSEPWIGQILVLLLQSADQEALTCVKNALITHHTNPVMKALHALVLVLTGTREKGLMLSERSIAEQPSSPMCWLCRGWIFLSLRKRSVWEECFAQALKTNISGDWHIPALSGLVFEKFEKWKEAASSYEKAATSLPLATFLWRSLAHCHKKLCQPRKMQAALRCALDPELALAESKKPDMQGSRPSPLKEIALRILHSFLGRAKQGSDGP